MKKSKPMQKFGAICIASALTLSSFGFINASAASDTTNANAVQVQITHTAFMKGYPDNTFRPEESITRAEIAQIIFNLSDDRRTNVPTFTDVTDSSAWYYSAIGHLEALSVIDGYPDGTFKPERPCARSEVVAILYRCYGDTSDMDTTSTDVRSAHWAASYLISAYFKGWISDYTDGTFEPDKYCTRAEAAALINRVFSRANENLSALSNPFTDISEEHWAFGDVMEACITHDFAGSIYHSVIAAYKQAFVCGYKYVDQEMINIEISANPYENSAVYYAYEDIDGNGVPELFIGAGEDAAKAIYDIYTYHDGKPVRLFDYSFGYRINCVVFPDGVLAVSWSNSAFESGKDFYRISADGFTPELIEGVSLYCSSEDLSVTCYRTTPESIHEITESEHTQIIQKYFGVAPVYRGVADLDWVRILEY